MLTIRNAIYIPKHVTKNDLTTISAVNKLGHDRIDIMKCSYKPMKHAVKVWLFLMKLCISLPKLTNKT